MTWPYNNQEEKKRTCKVVDVAALADHRVKLKENEKMAIYLDFARELSKLRNVKVTYIPIVEVHVV